MALSRDQRAGAALPSLASINQVLRGGWEAGQAAEPSGRRGVWWWQIGAAGKTGLVSACWLAAPGAGVWLCSHPAEVTASEQMTLVPELKRLPSLLGG